MQLPQFRDYIPEDWLNYPKRRERSFFYAILVTLAAPYCGSYTSLLVLAFFYIILLGFLIYVFSVYTEELIRDCRR